MYESSKKNDCGVGVIDKLGLDQQGNLGFGVILTVQLIQ